MTRRLLVIGPPRSGLGLACALASRLGLPAATVEDARTLMDISARVLGAVGGDGGRATDVGRDWELAPALRDLHVEARAFLDRTSAAVFAAPELALTLPFWRLAAPGLRTILMVRSPVEVMLSLADLGRDRLDVQQTWTAHMESALAVAPPDETLLLAFDDALEDAQGQLLRLAALVGCSQLHSSPGPRTELPTRRSSLLDDVVDPRLDRWTRSLYLAARLAAQLPGPHGPHVLALRAWATAGEPAASAGCSPRSTETPRAVTLAHAAPDLTAAAAVQADALAAAEKKRAYAELIDKIRRDLPQRLPLSAKVLVVSRGDSALVAFDSCQAQHFPSDDLGQYAGHHPADGRDVVDRLERARQSGDTHLLIPSTAFWWLDYYDGLERYLDTCRSIVVGEDYRLYGLEASRPADPSTPPAVGDAVQALVRALLPHNANIAVLMDADGRLDWPGLRVTCLSREDARDIDRDPARTSALMRRGVQYVVLPSPRGPSDPVAAGLRRIARVVTQQRHVCEILELQSPTRSQR